MIPITFSEQDAEDAGGALNYLDKYYDPKNGNGITARWDAAKNRYICTPNNSNHNSAIGPFAVEVKEPASVKRLDDEQVGGNHYSKKAITPWDVIEKNGERGFWADTALTYVMRLGDKGDDAERILDIEKAIHYLRKELQVRHKINSEYRRVE